MSTSKAPRWTCGDGQYYWRKTSENSLTIEEKSSDTSSYIRASIFIQGRSYKVTLFEGVKVKDSEWVCSRWASVKRVIKRHLIKIDEYHKRKLPAFEFPTLTEFKNAKSKNDPIIKKPLSILPNTMLAIDSSGSMNSEAMLEWFDDFIKRVPKKEDITSVVLFNEGIDHIFDGLKYAPVIRAVLQGILSCKGTYIDNVIEKAIKSNHNLLIYTDEEIYNYYPLKEIPDNLHISIINSKTNEFRFIQNPTTYLKFTKELAESMGFIKKGDYYYFEGLEVYVSEEESCKSVLKKLIKKGANKAISNLEDKFYEDRRMMQCYPPHWMM